VIGGSDITTEAAITKMMTVLAHTSNYEDARELLVTPLAGELS
jgi:L-asparaginase